jgi:hypothetical protein
MLVFSRSMQRRVYLTFNYTIAGIILAIFFCSLVVASPNIKAVPQKCPHEELLGGKCPTCGLFDGFSLLIRGKIKEARELQKNSISIFIFWAGQFLFRLIINLMLLRTQILIKSLMKADLMLSLLFFIATFGNVIPQSIYIFYKMLLTGNVM